MHSRVFALFFFYASVFCIPAPEITPLARLEERSPLEIGPLKIDQGPSGLCIALGPISGCIGGPSPGVSASGPAGTASAGLGGASAAFPGFPGLPGVTGTAGPGGASAAVPGATGTAGPGGASVAVPGATGTTDGEAGAGIGDMPAGMSMKRAAEPVPTLFGA